MSSDVSDSLCSASRIARVACMQRIVDMLWSLLKSMKLLCSVIIALPRASATQRLSRNTQRGRLTRTASPAPCTGRCRSSPCPR